ncbi:xylulokinase [Sugiyamaella lignohabitans]|uniref:Xylulose kinase n=1 Tax=Sugiyamaella lignohabitans TaxID=796027 RepID=A0A161HMB2_9ASCO|nr:xylulokinase [Sugiyamaella lignohabitans]ANB14787.1 xylulokinase [Sugiyamaella lignohabitans]
MSDDALYLGLDLSTQQLKGIIVNSSLDHVFHTKVEFDGDLPEYKTVKGVYNNPSEKEVQAPVVMWLDALDLLFKRIVDSGKVDLSKLRGISGACQQHGSVFWNSRAEAALADLSPSTTLKNNLQTSLSWQLSPNWQDHSTAKECKQFEEAIGGKEKLAEVTGSGPHRRFTGPQILRLKHKSPELYKATDRIALVSSFIASVLAGKFVGIDISDVCGMNLWDLEKKEWSPKLLELIAGDDETVEQVKHKLGPVEPKPKSIGNISSYFTEKYGVSDKCSIVPFTGDNPGTILSMPLETNDVIISLGTSTTALVVTEKYVPSAMYHMFTHPTGKGYMGMLCYCNGALAREQVRDEINKKYHVSDPQSWDKFNEFVLNRPILGDNPDECSIGFYFPLSEIIPDCPSTLKRFVWKKGQSEPQDVTQPSTASASEWQTPEDDALRILESQALSIRYRLAPMLTTESKTPRKVYFVGGTSRNDAICEALSRVLMPSEGSFRLDLADACAKGAANLAVFGASATTDTWEHFISSKYNYSTTQSVGGHHTQDRYAAAIDTFTKSEKYLHEHL